MKHIFDRIGLDASAGNMLRVPNDNYENFPTPADHRGGFYYDTEEEKMYYSDGINWSQVGTGNVTSVNATASGALSVTGGPIVNTGVLNFNWTGTSDYLVQGDGTLILKTSIIPVVISSALTKTDDTNVTLTLGGTPGTALLQNVSLTLGWNGVLAISRGGTGLGTLGTANQLLRVNSSATALEYFTPDWTSNTGTVTSFSAGNLSPLFTTNVATPTTTPALSFNLSNCNQYQVFGRVVAGTGAPSYVTLNPIAFNGLSLPNNQIAYGTGSGISSNGNLKYNGNSGLQIGGGTNPAYCAINIGNGVITNKSDFSFVLTENTANVISGLGNCVASFIIGSGNTITTGDITSAAYHNKIFGFNNSISAAPSKIAMYNFISGRDNIVTDGSYNNIFGRNVTNNGYYGCLALTDNGSSITLTANNQFTARFSGGYRFMKDGSTQWMAIAPTTGYVTINNIPTASGATDILVSNSGVVSKRTLASLNIPVVTPAALTKVDDTNVTISLGGTPSTALLQSVSMTLGWTGVLAIARGGTGLGTLGTANQVLRVNSAGTALEYATIADLDAQTLAWTKATSNLAISNGNSVNLFNLTSLASGDLIKWDGSDWVNFAPTWTSNTGTVTSVSATMGGNAATVSGSPITSSGTLAFSWLGSIYQYVRGDGTLAYLPPSANYLNDLLDVTITSPSTGQLLRYNGSEWVNWTPNFLTSNQTITLSGDVTGSGATSITTTIAANAVTTSKIANTAVTFAKFQNINTNRLLGRSTAGSGSVEEISIGSGLSLSGGTLSASGGGGSAVWKVQGGSTDASTNTQNIYHNANVWLGDGSGSSSSYRLQVSGISYFTGSMTLNNITSIQAWNNAASQQLKIAQLDSSNVFNYAENYLKVVGDGGNAGDITISAYPHTRKDSLSAYPRNVLVTNSSGNLLSLPGECYKNDNVNVALSSDESHSADSTWRAVTWDTVNTPSWSQYGKDTASGNMKMKLPTSTFEYGTHLIFVTISYTGGTASEVNAEVRINGSTVIGSATTNATASKNTLTFFTVIDNNATYQGSVVSLHLRIASGTGSITLKAGSKMVMIAGGAPLPA
jgi:hypothetical protein